MNPEPYPQMCLVQFETVIVLRNSYIKRLVQNPKSGFLFSASRAQTMAPKGKAVAAPKAKETAKDKKAREAAEAKDAVLDAATKARKRINQANMVTTLTKAPATDVDKAALLAEYTALGKNDPQKSLLLTKWLEDCNV